MLLIVAIPCFSYAIVSVVEIKNYWSEYETANVMEANNDGILHMSKVIEDLQKERSLNSNYVSGQKLEVINSQNEDTDASIEKLQAFLDSYPVKIAAEDVSIQLNNIAVLRKALDRKDSTADILRYNRLIKSLINLEKSTASYASAAIGSKIRSFLVLESARENADLLSVNLSKILSEDLPIDEARFQNILRFRAGVNSNLNSEALDLSPEASKLIKESWDQPHWKNVGQIFKTVITLANEGGYGVTETSFNSVMGRVKEDIKSLINIELEAIVAETSSEKSGVVDDLILNLLGMLANLFVILSSLILALRHLRMQLGKLTSEMDQSTNNVADTSSKLFATSQSLASVSQETAAALQETVSSMSEMNSMVSRTSDKSRETKLASEEIGMRVGKASDTVGEMVVSMEALSRSNEQLSEVNKVIRSISKQTKVINDIVFKTQLLAVNASIEAAKAGSQGKGFAVVADEVSKLAQLSGDASEKISLLLDESEDKVNAITKEVSRRVNRGSSTVDSVKAVFSEISDQVKQIKQLSDDMAQACEEQSFGIEQVTSAVAQIDKATHVNTSEAYLVEKQSSGLKHDSRGLQIVTRELLNVLFGNDKMSDKEESNENSKKNGGSGIQRPKKPNIAVSLEAVASSATDNDDSENLADHESFRPAS